MALQARDVDRRGGLLRVRRTVSSGEVVEYQGKTEKSIREVPMSRRALEALDAMPARIGAALLFPAPAGGIIELHNFRRREWTPAVEAAGVVTPARIYDLRSTFASDALAAGVSAFELARVMGTSTAMIERHYGTLLGGAIRGIADRLDAFDDVRDQDAEEASEGR